MKVVRTSRIAAALLAVVASSGLAQTATLASTAGLQQVSQATGRVVGRIIDAGTGQPLIGAQVQAVGSDVTTQSGVDGRYVLTPVPAGTLSIKAIRIGYSPKTVEGIAVPEGGAVVQDVSLSGAVVQLDAITVSAALEKGSVSQALDLQRTAVGVISTTTLEQIARSPDANVAQAVQRVSGVTVQDGRYVFVRGLGERYTTTSLNGARVPSPEPEKKVVPLDLFPSSLLEGITTSKTFTPDQAGDFSGAEVNLKTRSFPARRLVQFSLAGGYNSLATGSRVPTPPTAGGEWLATAAGQRKLPDALTGVTDFTRLTQNDVNTLIRSLPRDWTLRQATAPPNFSGGLSLGGESPAFGQRIGYIGSLSYSRSQEVHDQELRSRAVPADAAGTPKPYNPFLGATGRSSVLWGGLANLSTYVGRGTKVELNNTYDRTADNEAHEDWGTLEEFQQVDSIQRTSLRYVERTVRSNQLRAEHQLGTRNRVTWSLSSSGVTRVEPDRSDLAYGYEFAPTGQRLPLAWLGFIPEAAKRTSATLSEDALGASADYQVALGALDQAVSLKAGGAYRHVRRDSHTESYNLRALGLGSAARAATPDELFYGAYTAADSARITLEPNTSGGSYGATDRVSAGYLMAEVPLGSRLRIIGGARLERWSLDMDAEPSIGAVVNIARDNTDVLPSLAVNLRVADHQTIRVSATQTLSRPEYRELAPISYRDMLGEREVFGDSSLVRTLVQNYDARWEWYPRGDEVLSVALFAKHFLNPIEQVDVATSGASQLSFINAESAFNYGVELEVRKGLEFLSGALRPFGVFTNVTMMQSRINTSNSSLSALTNDRRPMVGQAPYVVNAGLSYANLSGGTSATLLYNVVGKRITSAAVAPLRVDTYEQPRHLVDFSIRFPLYRGMTLKLDAKNLFNAPYLERQGTVIRQRYVTGRSLTLGMSWALR